MASETTTTASLLQDEFEKILSAWLKAQAKEGVKRTDLVSAKETERQSRDLLTALARASQTAATDASFDFANPGWDPVRDAIVAGLKSFAGLPHRMQHVCAIDGVSFYNDGRSAPEKSQPIMKSSAAGKTNGRQG